MASSTVRGLLTSPVTNPSQLRSYLRHLHQQPPPPPPPFSHNLLVRPLLPAIKRRAASSTVVSCLISGVDGGGVSDDFVSTRKSGFSREFSVIANMLKRIEPLDVSVISQGVSDAAKDSMKQTISTMLGLLPSDQFSVTVKVSRRPLDRLIVSSIITGYTLWNAEYRISLMRNFDISLDNVERPELLEENGGSQLSLEDSENRGSEIRPDRSSEDLEGLNMESLGNLSPEVLSYIQHLESELSSVKQELHTCKQENMQMVYVKKSNNDLLEYLRSLESNMVTELSRPSSSEVDDFIHQLAQNVLQGFFKEDPVSYYTKDPGIGRMGNYDDAAECHDTINTSRDYLAKLLFWLVFFH
ncbi:OLC1v1009420C1 [Oldenlandia corymbosa var. corymbosa]|uniref:OLC1v1009420C1 n=1 Tax=Oldenlandia corymbosa var. corymbosa TaxID=529605 RepID=A0AAV1DRB5_OLDCO|nr:OLC1v1009420C1 [Oldenlandia corymbosa var. corymbosa]